MQKRRSWRVPQRFILENLASKKNGLENNVESAKCIPSLATIPTKRPYTTRSLKVFLQSGRVRLRIALGGRALAGRARQETQARQHGVHRKWGRFYLQCPLWSRPALIRPSFPGYHRKEIACPLVAGKFAVEECFLKCERLKVWPVLHFRKSAFWD